MHKYIRMRAYILVPALLAYFGEFICFLTGIHKGEMIHPSRHVLVNAYGSLFFFVAVNCNIFNCMCCLCVCVCVCVCVPASRPRPE